MNMVEDVRDKSKTREDKQNVEDDQVMSLLKHPRQKKRLSNTADVECQRNFRKPGKAPWPMIKSFIGKMKSVVMTIEAMVVTFLLFFEAQSGQLISMDEDVFDEVKSMVHMGEPKEIEVTREFPKAEVAQPQIMVPSLEKRTPEKVCYEIPTKRMAYHP
ncbi:hypothetical protein L3X38_042847 [Prunus dulcis]|uniref:Uncharacterized protein n=1 Tax=Prunus dulcis TaxID=3755 RepID=A0AAD4YLK5_PRUDU|nr:hypothetical protein L3X38_042847 [Prunus dulcis]